MERKIIIKIKFLTFLLLLPLYCTNHSVGEEINRCEKIISLAPSITETLYELNLYDNVAAVSKYDTYPSKVRTKTSIGGFLDPNIETIIKLKPTIVIGLAEHKDLLSKLNKLKINTTTVEHRSVDGILKSFLEIEKICNNYPQGTDLFNKTKNRLELVKEQTGKLPHKKIILVVSRNYESSTLKDVYLSGKDGFYDTLLSYASVTNVFKDMTSVMSAASNEGLYRLNPDIIIEVLPPNGIAQFGKERLLKSWSELSFLNAVKQEKIYFIDQDWATIPGPRMLLLLDWLVTTIHSN